MERKEIDTISFTGGGVNGLKSAFIYKNLDPLIDYDVMSGTSVGALIVALIECGYSADDIIEIFIKEMPLIFNKKCFRYGFKRSKYNNSYFKSAIKNYIGEKRMGDCKKLLIFPAINADLDRVKIFKSHHKGDEGVLLSDAVLASASAPMYFDMINIHGMMYKDGGVGYNNPADLILKECQVIGYGTINITSISTGKKKGKSTKGEVRGGIIGGLKPFITDSFREQDIKVHNNLVHDYKYLQKGTYKRLESITYFSSGKIDDASKKNVRNLVLDGEESVRIINSNKL